MVTKPQFAENANFSNGLAAVALFVVFAAIFLTTTFPEPAGFPQDASLVAGIGYAMFDLTGQSPVPTEGFLAAFEMVDIVLVGALVAAVMLASHESDRVKGMVTALTDGGSPTRAATEEHRSASSRAMPGDGEDGVADQSADEGGDQ